MKCRRFFKPEKNGVFALEQMPDGNDVRPGLEDAENWEPYKVWRADLYRCDGCGDEIIVGFGQHPLSEHYMPDFGKWLSFVTHVVNDR